MEDGSEREDLREKLAECRERNRIEHEKVKNILRSHPTDADYHAAMAASRLFDAVEMLCSMVVRDGADYLAMPEGQALLRNAGLRYRENMNFVDDERAAGVDFERDIVNIIEMLE